MQPEVSVVVLAAGNGTRMKSKTMKVLHPLAGHSMIGHVLRATAALQPGRTVAVVGNGREQVGPEVHRYVPDALLAVQHTQEGTGHAVRVAVEELAAHGVTAGVLLVMAADTPLLRGETLADLLAAHQQAQQSHEGYVATILTGVVDEPRGYGRIVRAADRGVVAIVEEKDATDEQRAITEINSGIFAFDLAFLADALTRITNDNASGEYYLTDVVEIAVRAGQIVGAHQAAEVVQTQGANDRAQLASLARILNQRIVTEWMLAGVTIQDPLTTWIDADVVLASDVTVLPGVQLLGHTRVEADAVIGPDCTVLNSTVGEGASVLRSHLLDAVVGPQATVGPFAYLRPGAELAQGAKAGTFVEIKNATLAPHAKVPHLSYIGDAEIGEGTNIGAGTIVANYDGQHKHRTVVGRHARTGSNNTFVAPVQIGDGASTGAGTVVRDDVPAGSLSINAVRQRSIPGWVAANRAGTAQAEAATAAEAPHDTP